MSDPLHRKEKPVLTPPPGELPSKSANPLVIALLIVGLFTLLFLAAIVVWLLPSKAPLIGNQNTPGAATVVHTNDTPIEVKRPAFIETEKLLNAWLKSQAAAEAEDIQQWGGEEYDNILTSAAQGDQLFQDKEFESARNQYRKAIDDLSLLLGTKGEKLKTAISRGNEFLGQLDAEKSLPAFQYALLIDPDNEQALHGKKRAQNLDQVLNLYKKSLQLETEGKLEQAQQFLLQASQTDKDFIPAQEALDRVDLQLQDIAFKEAMSRALAALGKGQLPAADQALSEAARLRPEDPALSAARKKSKEMHRAHQLKKLQIKADQLISAEDWKGVVQTYRQAIAIDNSIGFATIGLPEAEKRLQLDAAIQSILSQPERLQDEGPLRAAEKTLARARKVENPGKVLNAQVLSLSRLVQLASTTVSVILRSDNATEVEIYHIGRFQPFQEKEFLLKPGTYTVVGRRPGFRDTRIAIRIDAEMKMPVFFIRCEEPI